MKPKALDMVIAAAAALLSLLCLIPLVGRQGDTVSVICNGELIYSGSIYEDITLEVNGATVEIGGGHAYVAYSDCADGICVDMGDARPGRPVICVPKRLVVSVEAGDDAPDGVTR